MWFLQKEICPEKQFEPTSHHSHRRKGFQMLPLWKEVHPNKSFEQTPQNSHQKYWRLINHVRSDPKIINEPFLTHDNQIRIVNCCVLVSYPLLCGFELVALLVLEIMAAAVLSRFLSDCVNGTHFKIFMVVSEIVTHRFSHLRT